MSKPVAVLISDVHYNLNTLELADAAVNQAVNKANEFGVPLIVAGDLHDTKANMRAECVNKMIHTFARAKTQVYLLRGNHDSVNEKSYMHALDFLAPYAAIIWSESSNVTAPEGIYFIPYQHDSDNCRALIAKAQKTDVLIMHQGLRGSSSGEYIQDKSAINYEDVSDFRVISGHYHTRQDIKTGQAREGEVGLFSYIGNPYTLNFAEANDPEKGYQILMNDGTLEFVPTNLRRHVVYEIILHETPRTTMPLITPGDLLWIKIKGPKHELLTINKDNTRTEIEFHTGLTLPQSFRLDLIPTDVVSTKINTTNKTQREVLDELITSKVDLRDEIKSKLKNLWKRL